MKNNESILDSTEFLSERASKIRLSAKSIATGMRSGTFRSLRRGQGIEFSGVRDYFIGDDVRTIDWNVTARMNKPYVKIFDEERDMIVFIVLDRSLSMETGSGKKSRLKAASEAAALVALAAEQNASPVGAVFFDGEIQFTCAPKNGRDHAMLILNKLDHLNENRVQGSALVSALQGAINILKKRSLVVVISDFRCSGYETNLAQLAAKHDVLAINVTDAIDSDFPQIGTLHFTDNETMQEKTFPSMQMKFRKAWKSAFQNRIDRFTDFCKRRGVFSVTLATQDDPVFVLNQFFASKTSY